MLCKECGKEIDANKKFCKYCGTPIKQSEDIGHLANQTLRCAQCGATLKAGTTFCTQCGTPVSNNRSVINDTKKDTNKKPRRAGKIVILIITIVALLLIATVGYYFADQYGIFDKEKAQESERIEDENETEETEDAQETEADDIENDSDTSSVDVDGLASKIDSTYEMITKGIANNSYDAISVYNGVLAYSDQDVLKAIVVEKEYSSDGYAQKFYYDNGNLIFSIYENDDMHRFYYDNEQLIRWKYFADASKTKATNYDMESTTSYVGWEQRVKDDAEHMKKEWETAFSNKAMISKISNDTPMTDDVIDVEELVLEIRGKYDKITNGIASNSYDAVIVDDGVMAYADQNKICAIVVKKGYDNSDYTRYFYYDGDDLFFAYYEGDDSHRLYFDNGKLYRWRYCADASNNSKATNYDQENTTEYRRWETDVLNDSNQFKGLCDDAIENGVGTQDYVLPGSDMRYVSKEELKDFTADQCRLARNELYARHGRIFDDEFLQTYFSSKDWYSPSIATADYKESMLNEYEIANRDLIVEYEKERGYR